MHPQKFLSFSKNAQNEEKCDKKNFFNHRCDLLFANSFLSLRYWYCQVTSSTKSFLNSYSSSNYRWKDCPPNTTSDWGGAVDEIFICKRSFLRRKREGNTSKQKKKRKAYKKRLKEKEKLPRKEKETLPNKKNKKAL